MKRVKRKIEDYQDILYLEHYVSPNKIAMPMSKRAAQFSPFSAVVGHEASVKEAARITDKKKILDDMEKAVIDQKLRGLEKELHEGHEVVVNMVYFEPDARKNGGAYRTKVGKLKKIDAYEQKVYFTEGSHVDINEVYSINVQ